LGKETKLGHPWIFKEWREGRSFGGLLCAQSDSRFGQSTIEIVFNFGNKVQWEAFERAQLAFDFNFSYISG
jgi:hypothetical protein